MPHCGGGGAHGKKTKIKNRRENVRKVKIGPGGQHATNKNSRTERLHSKLAASRLDQVRCDQNTSREHMKIILGFPV